MVLRCVHVTLAHVAQRAGEKPAGAARRVKQNLAGLGIDAVGVFFELCGGWCSSNCVRQSSRAPENLTTFAHFAVSSLMKAAN